MTPAASLAAWLLSRRPLPTLLLVFLFLFAGFVAVATPPLQWVFGRVAEGIAAVAAFLLDLAGLDLDRTGIELRDLVTGHAIAVTSACDGHGLIIAAAALWIWLRTCTTSRQNWAKTLGLTLAAVLLFNLARILGLFLALGHSLIMSLQHLYATPLASVPLVAGIALYGRRLRPKALIRTPLTWLIVGVMAAVAWYFVQHQASCILAVPVANALLWLHPGPLLEGIACSGGHARIATSALISQAPPTPMSVSFAPADFLLPVPVIIASLTAAILTSRRRIGRLLILAAAAFLLMALAMALGALTLVHDQALAADLRYLGGRAFLEPYRPPSPGLVASLKAMQNVLVHFNLFVLPFALLAGIRSPEPPSTAPVGARKPRRARRRAR